MVRLSLAVNVKQSDPRVQGIKWLRTKEESSEVAEVLAQSKGWQRKVEQALSGGKVVIIENLGEEIDATLDVLSRAIYKKGVLCICDLAAKR